MNHCLQAMNLAQRITNHDYDAICTILTTQDDHPCHINNSPGELNQPSQPVLLVQSDVDGTGAGVNCAGAGVDVTGAVVNGTGASVDDDASMDSTGTGVGVNGTGVSVDAIEASVDGNGEGIFRPKLWSKRQE